MISGKSIVKLRLHATRRQLAGIKNTGLMQAGIEFHRKGLVIWPAPG
jgi:hypothetical protein